MGLRKQKKYCMLYIQGHFAIFSVYIGIRQMTNLKRGGWLHEKESDDRHLRLAGDRSSGTDPHASERRRHSCLSSYHAVLYQVEDVHRLGAVDTAEDEYLEGMIVRILGMEVYNSVE